MGLIDFEDWTHLSSLCSSLNLTLGFFRVKIEGHFVINAAQVECKRLVHAISVFNHSLWIVQWRERKIKTRFVSLITANE